VKILHSDLGNVAIEFVATAVALMIPIAYISTATLKIATSYIEVQNAARIGARAFVSASSDSTARVRAVNAINYSVSSNSINQIQIECTTNPCLTADGIVTVKVTRDILVSLPALLGSQRLTVTGLQAEAVQEPQ
jgi:Flp pilus assembly protein TadG